MELFTITCTTCRQRLKVCDASTIGEIQICPKCGSMVLVEPPAGWTGPPAAEPPISSPESAPPTRNVLPEEAPSAHSPSVSPPPAAEIPAEPSVTLADEPVGDSDARVAAAAAPPFAEPPLAPPLDGEPIAAEPILPTEDWTSQAASAPAMADAGRGCGGRGGVGAGLGGLFCLASRQPGEGCGRSGSRRSRSRRCGRLQTATGSHLQTQGIDGRAGGCNGCGAEPTLGGPGGDSGRRCPERAAHRRRS